GVVGLAGLDVVQDDELRPQVALLHPEDPGLQALGHQDEPVGLVQHVLPRGHPQAVRAEGGLAQLGEVGAQPLVGVQLVPQVGQVLLGLGGGVGEGRDELAVPVRRRPQRQDQVHQGGLAAAAGRDVGVPVRLGLGEGPQPGAGLAVQLQVQVGEGDLVAGLLGPVVVAEVEQAEGERVQAGEEPASLAGREQPGVELGDVLVQLEGLGVHVQQVGHQARASRAASRSKRPSMTSACISTVSRSDFTRSYRSSTASICCAPRLRYSETRQPFLASIKAMSCSAWLYQSARAITSSFVPPACGSAGSCRGGTRGPTYGPTASWWRTPIASEGGHQLPVTTSSGSESPWRYLTGTPFFRRPVCSSTLRARLRVLSSSSLFRREDHSSSCTRSVSWAIRLSSTARASASFSSTSTPSISTFI